MKKLLLAAVFSIVSAAAFAQTCPTRPPTDNSNACASTAFVQTAVGSGGVVTSVFGRAGTVVAATNDYVIGQIGNIGTSVATALGVNVGTAGSIVVNGGALGTPSSGVGTNLTGTAAGLTAGAANGLNSATTTVSVSAATAPSANQGLVATDSTHATWQALVNSWKGRTGAVTPASGDYTTAQLTTGTSGSSPSVGQLGETITNTGSAGVSIGNGTVVTLATVTLSAGDWNCYALAQITLGVNTVYTTDNMGITATPVSFPAFPAGIIGSNAAVTVSASTPTVFGFSVNGVIVRPTTSTSYSAVYQMAHSAGTVTAQGYLQCVRQD